MKAAAKAVQTEESKLTEKAISSGLSEKSSAT